MEVKSAHTESTIQETLKGFISSARFRLTNLYVFGWESDILFFTNSNYTYEIEIKISRADYKNDLKKTAKHDYLKDQTKKNKPNYFYYAVPENLIGLNEVPSYAGLIYITKYSYRIVRDAPKINKEKLDTNKLNLVDKFYYNFLNVRNELILLKNQVKNRNLERSKIYHQFNEKLESEWKKRESALEEKIAISLCGKYDRFQGCLLNTDKIKRLRPCHICDLDCEFAENIRKIISDKQ